MSERRLQRRWVLAESDPHAGHKLGLCNPDALILEPDNKQGIRVKPTLTEFQTYIWDLRQEYLNNVWTMTGYSPVVYFMAGDATHGKDHGEQLMASRQADQRAIAKANAAPVLEQRNVKTARLITGTGVHVFGEGSSEIDLCESLADKWPKKDIGVVHHGRPLIDGVRFDLAHRGPSGGSRWWLRGNTARYYLRDRMLDDMALGKRPADVYLRGHYHVNIWETLRMEWRGEMIESHLILLPSWCGLGDYARGITGSTPKITNGLYLFELRGGAVTVHPMTRTMDLRMEEEL